MISKKFLGILVLVFLASFLLLTNVSAAGCNCILIQDVGQLICVPNDASCPNGVQTDNCADNFDPETMTCTGSCTCNPSSCTSNCVPGSPSTCVGTYSIRRCSLIEDPSCYMWTKSVCGSEYCNEVDQCTGVTTYLDYPTMCQLQCNSAASPDVCFSTCSCTPTSSQTCDASKSCQTATCNGVSITCHYSGGIWRWDSSAPECGVIPTSPKLIFYSYPSNVASIGSNGVMYISGQLWINQPPMSEVSGSGEFLVKDSAGNIMAKITNGGYVLLRGIWSQKTQPELNNYLSDSGKQFLVKSGPNVVAVFDQSGNFYTLGPLVPNQNP